MNKQIEVRQLLSRLTKARWRLNEGRVSQYKLIALQNNNGTYFLILVGAYAQP